ncbi:MAG: hypothetical protein M3P11_12980 [Actinomycetota bacterium]|nr:hypothetical protein [Actinomycetota bacterium]
MQTSLAIFENARWAWGIVAVLGALVLAIAVLLLMWGPLTISKLQPSFYFALETIYLVALILAAILYLSNFYGIKDEVPWLIAGLLPLGVPWFGALGGVIISLQGIFEYNAPAKWDPTYGHWHILRPLFGSVVAVVGFLLFLAVLNAASTPPHFTTPGQTSTALDLVIYYALAFLLGYREATFRELIKRVTDIILQPGSAATPVTPPPPIQFRIDGAPTTSYDFGTVAVGETPSVDTQVVNISTATITNAVATLVPQGAVPVDGLTLVNAPALGDLAVDQPVAVTIRYAPAAPGERGALLLISSLDLASPAAMKIAAKT